MTYHLIALVEAILSVLVWCDMAALVENQAIRPNPVSQIVMMVSIVLYRVCLSDMK